MINEKKKILIVASFIVAVPVAFIVWRALSAWLPAGPVHLFPGPTDKPGMLLTGTVTDTATGQPIAGVKVWDDFGQERGAITNSDGKYSYHTWPEEHFVRAEAPGYRAQRQILLTSFWGTEKKKIVDFVLERE